MTIKSLLIFTLLIFSTDSSFGQRNFNELFEESRGTWDLPLLKFKKVEDIDSRRHAFTSDRTDSSLTFVTDSAYDIKAVHDGVVQILFSINNSYTFGTKYGDYFYNL